MNLPASTLIPKQATTSPDRTSGLLQRACACGQHALNGECEACNKKKSANLQRSRAPGNARGNYDSIPASVHETLRSPGSPLDATTRAYMEPRFGHDFSGVRVHTDARAGESAQAVGALAYTVGRDVVFGPGQYQPGIVAGRKLLAHELTHTVQQAPLSPSRPSGLKIDPEPALEYEAENFSRDLSLTAPAERTPLFRMASAGLLRQTPPATCRTTYTPATSFSSLIALVRAAESMLISCGFSSPDDRIHILRGIYYGTTWSADYGVERSPVRNLGFQVYTGSTTPEDPRGCLTCGMFDALRGSQDIVDGSRRVDFGHLIIGMDARRSRVARSVPIPTQGATGLAISTWVGDLGGGAAMLSLARVTAPTTPAVRYFRGSDFGGSINLEGDVAGYVVGAGSTPGTAPAAPVLPASGLIADALQDYLIPSGTGPSWNSRCQDFLAMMGGVISGGALTNRSAVVSNFEGQIRDFACWYLVNRLRQSSRLSLTTLEAASTHIDGAAHETAEVFVDALDYCLSHPGSAIQARGSGPAPTPAGSATGSCLMAIQGMRAAQAAERGLREAEQRLHEVERGAQDLYRDFRSWF